MNRLKLRPFQCLKAWLKSHALGLSSLFIFLVITVIVLAPQIFIKIPAGYNGVLYRTLGGGVVEDMVLNEGLHVILPWNSVTQYDSRIQVKKLELDVLTLDQLKSKVTVTFQFEINRLTVPLLHKYVGPDYLNKIVVPEVTSITREIIGKLHSSRAFTSGIPDFIRDIEIGADNVLINKLSPPGLSSVRLLRISAVQLESISYPQSIQDAIVDKMVQEQRAESYKYRIEAEKLEVERKIIEATGIKEFQDIVNSGMTENFLKYQGVDATRRLAESSNSKIIIFGSSPSGLPLILGGDVPSVPPVSPKQEKSGQ